MLRGRLGDDEMFPGSMRFEPVRSSSAPPTQESQFFSNHAFELSDPRMDPEYAVYYSNNMRMDPRLPPTAFAPGHSWKQSRPALAPPSLLSRTPQPWGDDGMDRQPMMHPSSIRVRLDGICIHIHIVLHRNTIHLHCRMGVRCSSQMPGQWRLQIQSLASQFHILRLHQVWRLLLCHILPAQSPLRPVS